MCRVTAVFGEVHLHWDQPLPVMNDTQEPCAPAVICLQGHCRAEPEPERDHPVVERLLPVWEDVDTVPD